MSIEFTFSSQKYIRKYLKVFIQTSILEKWLGYKINKNRKIKYNQILLYCNAFFLVNLFIGLQAYD